MATGRRCIPGTGDTEAKSCDNPQEIFRIYSLSQEPVAPILARLDTTIWLTTAREMPSPWTRKRIFTGFR